MSAVSTAYTDTALWVATYRYSYTAHIHQVSFLSWIHWGRKPRSYLLDRLEATNKQTVKSCYTLYNAVADPRFPREEPIPIHFQIGFRFRSVQMNLYKTRLELWTLKPCLLVTFLACFCQRHIWSLFFITFCNVMCEHGYRNSFNQFRSSEKNDAKNVTCKQGLKELLHLRILYVNYSIRIIMDCIVPSGCIHTSDCLNYCDYNATHNYANSLRNSSRLKNRRCEWTLILYLCCTLQCIRRTVPRPFGCRRGGTPHCRRSDRTGSPAPSPCTGDFCRGSAPEIKYNTYCQQNSTSNFWLDH